MNFWNGGIIFLQNNGIILQYDTVSQPQTLQSDQSFPRKPVNFYKDMCNAMFKCVIVNIVDIRSHMNT
jgi:hypothetical protein